MANCSLIFPVFSLALRQQVEPLAPVSDLQICSEFWSHEFLGTFRRATKPLLKPMESQAGFLETRKRSQERPTRMAPMKEEALMATAGGPWLEITNNASCFLSPNGGTRRE